MKQWLVQKVTTRAHVCEELCVVDTVDRLAHELA